MAAFAFSAAMAVLPLLQAASAPPIRRRAIAIDRIIDEDRLPTQALESAALALASAREF
jgi:hypothetical protein